MAGLQLTKNTMWNLVQIYRSLSAHKTGGYLSMHNAETPNIRKGEWRGAAAPK